ncbi:MAG TPA: hypothetical protein VKZ69_02360 [Limnochordales bacterium]|nr:hypothetical protein [Limnochordales bacterium]
MHDFSAAERQATARFNGAPGGNFIVKGTPVESGGFVAALGLSGRASERVTWSLSYAGEFRVDGSSHQLQGSLGISF